MTNYSHLPKMPSSERGVRMWLLKLLVRSAGPDAIDLRDYLRPLIVDVRLKGLVYFDGVAFQPIVV